MQSRLAKLSGCGKPEPHAKWVYFGIDVLNHDSIVNLTGNQAWAFPIKRPQMKFIC